MKKNLSLLIFACSFLLFNSGCTPTLPVVVNEEIDYSQGIEVTWNEYDKLSYLLEWMIDIRNDKADTWNKPLNTDKQKWTFIFNILNNNYLDKYENPEEASKNPWFLNPSQFFTETSS